jgi:hypothetical protein
MWGPWLGGTWGIDATTVARRLGRPGAVALVATLLAAAAPAAPAGAASGKQCRQACRTTIAACAERARQFGDLARACRRAVVKRCRRQGTASCSEAQPICGDGVARAAEVCDGADLAGATCEALGYASGSLSCGEACRYDVGGCTGGIGASPVPRTCVEAGAGTVGCTAEIIEESPLSLFECLHASVSTCECCRDVFGEERCLDTLNPGDVCTSWNPPSSCLPYKFCSVVYAFL